MPKELYVDFDMPPKASHKPASSPDAMDPNQIQALKHHDKIHGRPQGRITQTTSSTTRRICQLAFLDEDGEQGMLKSLIGTCITFRSE